MSTTSLLDARHAFSSLLDPTAGLLSSVSEMPRPAGSADVHVFGARLGDVGEVLSNVEAARNYRRTRDDLDGAGGSADRDRAFVVAAAEGVERYASSVFSDAQLRWASAGELTGRVLDLLAVPRCSDAELGHPLSPVLAPNPQAPVRWVRGVSLMTGEPTWIPAVMVYLFIHYESPGERFWMPISTGCAGHFDLDQALLNATLEVVERDAISVVWHQMLDLPEVDPPLDNRTVREALRQLERSSISIRFFDATFEHGIPTIYAVERAHDDPDIHTIVMCSCEVDPGDAIAKIVRESASSRIAITDMAKRWKPKPVAEFSDVCDGAMHLAPRSMASSFDFLTYERAARVAPPAPIDTGSSSANLREVIRRLGAAGHEAFAVDLTTDECRSIGFNAVRVVVPSLQPLSFSPTAQFKGSSRLYHVPALLGQPVRSESQLNPQPQPFA